MPAKVVVTKVNSTDAPDEYFFDRLPIIIGRAGTSHLTLPDTKRAVSKEHAQLTEVDETFYLTDLGSTNSTYLNGRRLEPHQAYAIAESDTVHIGDFVIRFLELVSLADLSQAAVEEQPDSSKNLNPFSEEVTKLVRSISAIRAIYDQQPILGRTEGLAATLREQFGAHGEHEVDALIAEIVAPLKTMVEMRPTTTRKTDVPAAPVVHGAVDRTDQVLTILLDAVARLGGIPWRFRHEFIGQTVIQAADTAFLYESDGAELKAALLHDSIDARDFEKRVHQVRNALEDLTLHQVALLDGYKAAVQHGAQHMLNQLDPAVAAAEFANGGVLTKIFPAKLKAEIFDRLAEQARELRSDDWSAAEWNIYRPAFIKAYLARMTSVRR